MNSFNFKLRWLGFILYFAVLFTLPFGFLADLTGTLVGLSLFIVSLIFLKVTGKIRIITKLKLNKIYPADIQGLFASLSSYAHRLEIPLPEVYLLRSPGLNIGCFSLSKKESLIFITEGLIDKLPRAELIALIVRTLVEIKSAQLRNLSWLSQFLILLERPTTMDYVQNRSHTRRFYPFSVFVRQLVLYPLSWIPIHLIGVKEKPELMDEMTSFLIGDRRALSEAFRRMEATRERTPLFIPFSYHSLFLVSAECIDPIAKIFVKSHSLNDRIFQLEGRGLT